MTSTSTTHRAVLAGGLAAVPATSLPALASPDPILAAIRAHRRAVAAYQAAFEISGNMAAGDPGFPAAAAVTSRGFAALEDAGVRLIEVSPTTLAGVAAVLAYIAECAHGEDAVWRLPDRLVDHGGRYQRSGYGDDRAPAQGSEPFAHIAIRSAAETIRRLAAG
jgi:hypothetical protein